MRYFYWKIAKIAGCSAPKPHDPGGWGLFPQPPAAESFVLKFLPTLSLKIPGYGTVVVQFTISSLISQHNTHNTTLVFELQYISLNYLWFWREFIESSHSESVFKLNCFQFLTNLRSGACSKIKNKKSAALQC